MQATAIGLDLARKVFQVHAASASTPFQAWVSSLRLRSRRASRIHSAFRSAGEFVAWLGLVPRQNSSGGKDRLSGVTKMGDKHIHNLLVLGATGTMRHA